MGLYGCVNTGIFLHLCTITSNKTLSVSRHLARGLEINEIIFDAAKNAAPGLAHSRTSVQLEKLSDMDEVPL